MTDFSITTLPLTPADKRTVGVGEEGPDVRLIDLGRHIILDNGVVAVTISKPGGCITGIQFGGLDNVLEVENTETNRGYWDLVWNKPGGKGIFDVISGTDYYIVEETSDKVEVSFVRLYDPTSNPASMVPLNIDKRFILLRGNTGFYSYAIYEHRSGWPDFDLGETRIAFKLRKDRFQYMAIADNKQRVMPSPDDRLPSRCQQLCYPEAVVLTNPGNPELKGEVDDKYQYSCDNSAGGVHGWISSDPLVGFWVITPSNEFRNGGITKQNLTSHVGPTSLSVFHGSHYAGEALSPQFRDGEAWKKVFGPIFIYLNSAPLYFPEFIIWEDAKLQMGSEVLAWPYSWPASLDYPKADERGQVIGRLLVLDRYVSSTTIPAEYAFLGLASPGAVGSWQVESKGYQFWIQADATGFFNITNVRPGEYNLYGWIIGFLGDYKKEEIIYIEPGSTLDLGELVFIPPRDGQTVWEIGIPDRSAAEFFVPDPNPRYINKLYIDHPERYRQYGLWERYSELYPDADLIYNVGESDWTKDWFFAHVSRIGKDGNLQPTTWQVKFQLVKVIIGIYKLRLAFAAAAYAAIEVRFNDPNAHKPLFDTMQFGKDNAIARHGIHGLNYLFHIDVPSTILKEGENVLFLTQRKTTSCLTGAMYDYLRLEEPYASENFIE